MSLLKGTDPGKFTLQKGGEEKVYRCPKCGRQKYYVNEGKGVSHCFRCGLSKKDMKRERKFKVRIEEPVEELKLPVYSIFGVWNKAQRVFMERKGIAAPLKGWGVCQDGRIFIPIKEEGKIVSWVARSVNDEKPKELSGPNRSHFLYGYDDIAHYGQRCRVILVEGIFDAEALKLKGYYALALMGSHLSDIQMGKLLKLTPLKIIIMMDGDEAGRQASMKICRKIINRLDPFRVAMAFCPKDKDPDELDAEETRKIIEEAL